MIKKKIIPKGWNPDDPKKVTEWMAKLPPVKDYGAVMELDKMYEKLKK